MRTRREQGQRDRILALLVDARGGPVPAPALAAIALQYSARIFELRRKGFDIRNETKIVDGQCHSSFRLQFVASPRPAPAPAAPATPMQPMFPSLVARHKDE